MDKPVYNRKHLDWLQYLDELSSSGNKAQPATAPQTDLLHKLFVPQWVTVRLSKSQASALIDRALKERSAWFAEQEQKQIERKQSFIAKQPAVKPVKQQMPRDPKTGLIGSEMQTQWADRIRTSLKPYLEKMRQVTVPNSQTFTLISKSLKVDDARFWIAYKSCDVDPAIFQRMLADVERRLFLAKPIRDWIEIPDAR